jgi:5-methylcytosine-specific restriction endonuclease McrA
MLSKPFACPKPSARLSRVAERVARRRQREEADRVWRATIWSRDRGRCVVCGRAVKRTLGLDPLRGEVHHIRGRNVAPESRCDPRNGVLTCLLCHLKLTRHEITLPRPRL